MLKEFIDQLNKLPEKALTRATGIDTDKPLIGIISAQNDLSFAHSNLEELVARVEQGVIANGANAKVLHIATVDCSVLRGQSAKYDLPSRHFTSYSVELICSNDFYDGLVFVASEPTVVCGMLIAAIRLNIPCTFVCGGTMSPILHQHKEYGYSFFYEQMADIKNGKV